MTSIRFLFLSGLAGCAPAAGPPAAAALETRSLPAPETPAEAPWSRRHSVRAWSAAPLTLAQVAQLAWAAQGINDGGTRRTAPSAGALYPLEVYVVPRDVPELGLGVFRYQPAGHTLVQLSAADRHAEVAAATRQQDWVGQAPVLLVITGVVERTAVRYGARAERYVQMEAGAAAENVALQAVVLGLGATFVGAFDDDRLARVLGLPPHEQPLLVLPVGVAP